MNPVESFVQTAVDYLRAEGERRPIAFDAARNQLVVGTPPDPVSFIFLGHAHAECGTLRPADRPRALSRRLWSSVRRSDEGARDITPYLLPRLRDRAWFSAVRRQAELELGADEEAINEVMLPHQVLNDELAVHLAFELPTSVTEVGADRLEAWHRDFAELYGVALDNLRRRSGGAFERTQPGLYTSPFRDTFDASRLVLPELFNSLELKGAPVVLAPTHDLVFVTGDADADGLLQAATWAEEALMEPRAFTAVAFRLEETRWVPWMPPRRHRAWAKLKMLRLQTMASAYARQKEVLDALLEANGHDISVVPLRAFRTPKGEVFTASAWVENLDSLLPETDRLDFVRGTAEGARASPEQVWSTTFEVARRTVGDLMVPTGDRPERFRVRGFPTLAQLEQMASEGHLPD